MPGPLTVVLPITPSQINRARKEYLPRHVAQAFNELLKENLRGNEARFSQDAAVERILMHAERLKTPLTRNDVFAQHLLDVEKHYGEYGWKVRHSKQSIGSSDPSAFVFTVNPDFEEVRLPTTPGIARHL